MKINTSRLLTIVSLLSLSLIPSLAWGADWYDTDWKFTKSLVINSTEINGTHTNFVLMVNITDINLATNADPSGSDILFTNDQNVTKLDHEIDFFNSTTGHLLAWVKVPMVSDASDIRLNMYYGDTGGNGFQNNTAATWSNGYLGVWHFQGNYLDSTGNEHHGINSGLSTITNSTCPFGYCVYADGINDIVTIGNSTDFNFTGNTPFNLGMWGYVDEGNIASFGIRIEKRDNDACCGVDNGYAFYYNEVENATRFVIEELNTNVNNLVDGQDVPSWSGVSEREKWYNHNARWSALVETRGDMFQLTNGTLSGFYDGGTQAINDFGSNATLVFFNNELLSSDAKGFFDEFRISNVLRTDEWHETQWNNMKFDGTNVFLAVGSQNEIQNLAGLRNTFFLYLNTPDANRLGGIFTGSCVGRVLGINSTGHLICGEMLVINPLNATQDFNIENNVNMSGFTVVNSTQFTLADDGMSVTCNFSGLVKISGSVYLVTTVIRAAVVIQPEIDGNDIGGWGATGYIRNTVGHNHASLHGQSIGLCNQGELITFDTTRDAVAGVVTLSNEANPSSVFIFERLS